MNETATETETEIVNVIVIGDIEVAWYLNPKTFLHLPGPTALMAVVQVGITTLTKIIIQTVATIARTVLNVEVPVISRPLIQGIMQEIVDLEIVVVKD